MSNESSNKGSKTASSFPRGTALPAQSPIFWVGQKDRYLRQLLIRDIEETTGRRLVVYFANRYEPGSDIEAQDLGYLTELLSDVSQRPVDLFVETNGGQTDATEAIVSMITKTVTDLRVIVANAAKSNGTLLAFCADSIIMGASSELGPIEPSLNGIPTSILTTPQIAQTNFPLSALAQYALEQSKSLATKLLSRGMMSGKSPDVIAQTVEILLTRKVFPSHGSVVDADEAIGLGLNVTYLPPSDDLWRHLWLLYCLYDADTKRDRLLKIFEGRSLSLSIRQNKA